MMVRLMLSSVIYGDRRDTSEFMSGQGHMDTRKSMSGQVYVDTRESIGGKEYSPALACGDGKDTGEFVRQPAKVEDNRADWKRRREYFEQKISLLFAQ